MKLSNPKVRVNKALFVILLTAFCVFSIRVLVATDTFHSGLLYLAIPFALSMAIYYFTPITDGSSWKGRFWNNLRYNLIVLFAVSIVLMEGYICVVMFMPIFFLVVILAFLADYIRHRSDKTSINAHVVPAIVVLLSVEGVSDATSFNRYNEVSYSHIVSASPEEILHTLSQPMELQDNRHWMLRLFPMPTHFEAGSLEEGDVHRLDFVYHRWFTTNTHEGKMEVTLKQVSDLRVKTEIEDTSYISNYMDLHGTDLQLEPMDGGKTMATLTVRFDRLLDPVWYFEPLERYAVRKSAEYLLNEMLVSKVPAPARSEVADG